VAPCRVTTSGESALFACAQNKLLLMRNWSNGDMRSLVELTDSLAQLASSKDASESSREPVRITAIALSPAGEPALATDRGKVLAWSAADKQFSALQFPGRVDALGYDGRMLLVGGRFSGIYLLDRTKPDSQPEQIVRDASEVTTLILQTTSKPGGPSE